MSWAQSTTPSAASIGAQPADADLTAVAAGGAGTAGLAVLAGETQANGRTALGLGTASTQATGAFQTANANLTSVASAAAPGATGLSLLAAATQAAAQAIMGSTGGPVSTSVSPNANQASIATVPGFTLSDPNTKLVSATTDANSKITVTGTAAVGDYSTATQPRYQRTVLSRPVYGMVFRIGVTSSDATAVVLGADAGLADSGLTQVVQFRLMNDINGERLRCTIGLNYVGQNVLVTGLAAGGIWCRIWIVGLTMRAEYSLTVSATEPAGSDASWTYMHQQEIGEQGVNGWREILGVVKVTSTVSPVGVFSGIRTISQSIFAT